MKIILPVSIVILSIAFTACSSAPTANQVIKSGNAAANAPMNALADTTAPASDRSPTETIRALNAAYKSKDAAAIKNLVSNGSLKLIEESAKE